MSYEDSSNEVPFDAQLQRRLVRAGSIAVLATTVGITGYSLISDTHHQTDRTEVNVSSNNANSVPQITASTDLQEVADNGADRKKNTSPLETGSLVAGISAVGLEIVKARKRRIPLVDMHGNPVDGMIRDRDPVFGSELEADFYEIVFPPEEPGHDVE
jgi:hypothetical protein